MIRHNTPQKIQEYPIDSNHKIKLCERCHDIFENRPIPKDVQILINNFFIKNHVK